MLHNNSHPIEAGILVKLKNEYLTYYVDSFLESGGINFCIVMEYCEV